MIRLSSKKILISTCLLLVLASGMMMQITAQSTFFVSVCFDLEFGRLEVLINDEPFCIVLSEAPVGTDGGVPIQLNGEVFAGTCHDPDNLIGTFMGVLIFEEGSVEDEFTVTLEFTLIRTDGILYSKSKFTGAIVGEDSIIALNIIESEYAYFESNGVRVNLIFIGLEPESGTITFVENDVNLICLPAFIFTIETTVGGILLPIDKLAVLIPTLVITGLVAVVISVFIVRRYKK